jgi:MoaA/NifB/PqqE/SkfB family radical SAM enzyme
MFKFNELKQIHLEISSNCQASCPMCTRNVHGGLENELLSVSDWTIDRFKTIINKEVLQQVESLYLCGNYGDPLLNKDLLGMVAYAANERSDIDIRIHTNGSLRSKDWWEHLAMTLPEKHLVVFALDGLADTHSLYRIGTDFDKIIENAKAFIAAGGRAEWAYLRFKHNEHQVDAARQMAKKLGFADFVMKDSSRWIMDTKFPVYDKQGETTHYLEPSEYTTLKFIDKKVLDNYKTILTQTKIDCHALKIKEIYIDAQGNVFPCCWLAMIPYQPMDREAEVLPIRQEILRQYYELVKSLGGIDALNGEKKTVKDIINSEAYQTVWDSYWNDNKLITCARSCGVLPEVFSTPRDQFTKREALHDE